MSPAFEMNAAQRAVMMEVIDMYKTMSFLWSPSHPSYQDRPLRVKAYKKLLEKYRELDKDATIAIIKAKLDNMRTGYARELKKVREAQNNSAFGTDAEYVYRPCLWYYDLFSFLESTILNNTKRKKIKAELEDQDTTECVVYEDYDEDSQHNTEYSLPAEYLEDDEQSNNSSEEIPVKKKKYDIQVEPADCAPYQEGDWEIIGKAIGVQLKNADEHQAAIAQKLIAEAIFYAKLGRLREESYVCIN